MSGTTNSAPQNRDVTRGRPVITRSMRFAILAFIGVLFLLLLAYMFLVGSKQVPRDDGYKAQAGRSFIAPHLPPVVRAKPAAHAPAPPSGLPAVGSTATTPVAAPMGFGALEDTAANTAPAPQPAATPAAAVVAADKPKEDPQEEGTAEQRKANVGRAVIGKPFNMHLLLRRNTIFHCIVEEQINTAVPGPLSCTLADDVMSADGTVVLIEKGAIVNGEVMDTPVDGEDRVFIGFDEVVTQGGLPIYFNGSGGDELGTSGVPGVVNEHMWRKLKATLLLAAVQIGGNVAQNQTQKAGTMNLNVGGSYGTTLAQSALERDLNIRSTLYDPQAKVITITVRQDIPFDKVYRLRARGM